nr:unnamed protein product [Spirometra erinaceieuropaei]
MGEIGKNLLLQRIAEQVREQRMISDPALENRFRELPNPTSPRNDKLMHNLSSKELTKDQMQVLRREASFNTTDAKPVNMIAAVESILCQTEATEETKNLIRHQASSLLMAHRPREMLSKVERNALRELKADKDLVIVPADKGRATVVLDRTNYLKKAKGLLEDRQFYGPYATKPLKALTHKINATLLALENSGAITPTDRRMARPKDRFWPDSMASLRCTKSALLSDPSFRSKGDEGQADVSALECADLGETEYAQSLGRRLNVQQDFTCSSRLVGTKGQPQTPNADTASYQTNHHQHDSTPAAAAAAAAAAARQTAKCKMQYNRQEAEDVVSPPVSELLSQTSVFPGSKTESELFRDLTCGSAAAAAATCWRPGKNYGSVASTILTASSPSASSLTCDTFPPRLAAAAASAGQGTDTYLRNPLIFQSHCNTSGLGSGGSSRCPPERPGSGSTASSPGRPEKLAGVECPLTPPPSSPLPDINQLIFVAISKFLSD